MVLFFVIISCFCVGVAPQATSNFGQLEIVSDLLPEDCFNDAPVLNYKVDLNNGLPGCTNTFNNNQACNKFFNPKSLYHYEKMNYKPTNCAKDGSFGPKQCKGERTTGRCFCMDKGGKRLFGQEWWIQADNQTCACSRRKSEMAELESVYFNSVHCDSTGNYESFQCDVLSQQCWCADERTGDLTSPVVPQAAMTKLPCYKSLTMGTQYLRQCENQKYAQKTIEYRLKLRGTIGSFGNLVCDDDGTYGAYSVIEGSAYCVWRDKTKIGSYQSGDTIGVNCNCARDIKIFSEAGKTQALKCSASGNYQPFQQTGTKAYCVDNDGYKKSPANEAPETEDDCANYKNYDD